MQHTSKPMRTMTYGILTTVISVLVLTLFNIFTKTIPELEHRINTLEERDDTNAYYKRVPVLESRVDVLESKMKEQSRSLERIDQRTEKIYDILMGRGRND